MVTFVCVDGASFSLTPETGLTLSTSSGTISSVSQSKFSVDSLNILIEDDINTWISSFSTSYTFNNYTTPGTLTGGSVSISDLSSILKADGNFVVLDTTIASVTHTVSTPAIDPATNSPDPNPTHSSDLSFSDAGQSKLRSN